MNVAANVKSVGIGVALLVGAYVVYKIYAGTADAAAAIKKKLAQPELFKISSQNNFVNQGFNAVTGGPGSGDKQAWTLGTKIYDWTH